MKLIFHLAEGKTEEFSTDKDLVIVGRGNTCDVVLPFEGFSRKHAQIELINGEIYVTDLGSTNGVFIDGQRIPASEKTQTQTFFNLQIGPAHQVEIIDDKASDAGPQYTTKEITGSDLKRESIRAAGSEHTKTTRMDSKLLKTPSEIKKSERVSHRGAAARSASQSTQSKAPMALVAVLVVAAGIYYFMSQNTEEAAPVTQSAQITGEPTVPLTETNFISAAMLESLSKNKTCEADKQSWCKDAGILSSRQEGVLAEGKSLIVYMNMTPFLAEKFENAFGGLGEKEKLEVLLLKRVFNSTLIRSLSRQTNFDTVQVVGGKVENGELKVSLAIKIRRDVDLKGFDKFFMIALFDQILGQGKVEEISKISSLYEKLPIN